MFINKLHDRKEAGLLLAERLMKYKNTDAVVLAVPRGGVPVGHEIAKTLGLELDIVLSKKIGHPMNPEFAIGSVTVDTVIVDPHGDVPFDYIENEISRIKKELNEKYKRYRGEHRPADIRGRTVIIVDDGIATGNTLLATVQMLRRKSPKSIVVASPVVPHDRVQRIRQAVDEFVFLFAPEYFTGVGAYYKDFGQTSDEEVKRLLSDNTKSDPGSDSGSEDVPEEEAFSDLFME